MLGHARVAITLDARSHVSDQMHAETAEKIGRQLFEPTGSSASNVT